MAEKRKSSKKTSPKKPVTPKTRAKKSTKKPSKTEAKAQIHLLAPLPNVLKLTTQVFSIYKKFWRPLLGIVVVYLVLNVIFASGMSNLTSSVNDIKANLNDSTGSTAHPLTKAISGFGTLVGTAGVSGSASGSILQSVLFVLESLVIIWALRQLLAGKIIGVKEAYYHSMYPLVPFLLIIFVIILELLPITVGAAFLTAVLTSAVSSLTLASWLSWMFFLLLAGWSFYMLSSSIFALYIVTLPEMMPRDALRSAKNLVRYRRWAVIGRVVYMPLFILFAMAVIIVPLILVASFLVAPVFYILGMLAILFMHSYLYSLYRGLLV
ncbi:hypothetical protein KW789_02475 [Candidatus Saccharibacteria bacterium]|nr:hypothetical protein [Candidatus Saccharibacteria bacterium]